MRSGAFLISGLEDKTLRVKNIEKIIIPGEKKENLAQELNSLGINKSSLFPKLEYYIDARAVSFIRIMASFDMAGKTVLKPPAGRDRDRLLQQIEERFERICVVRLPSARLPAGQTRQTRYFA